jgi:hypothetical protein
MNCTTYIITYTFHPRLYEPSIEIENNDKIYMNSYYTTADYSEHRYGTHRLSFSVRKVDDVTHRNYLN